MQVINVHALSSDVNYINAVLVLMLACFGNNGLDVEKSRLSIIRDHNVFMEHFFSCNILNTVPFLCVQLGSHYL